MISHKVIESTAAAESYYMEMKGDGRAEYYKGERPNEAWGGSGLSYAGLEDRTFVSKEDFTSVLNGKMFNAVSGQVQSLDNGKGEHTPAIDLTISAPKSVSVMAFVGQDTRIIEALGRASDRAMAAIEANVTVRRRQDGEMHHVNPGNLVYARFEHDTSRENDPNWHRHYVIANAAFDRETGQWRSIEMGSVMRLKRMGDEIFKNELAKELKAIGYQVDWTKDGPEIRGVERHQIEKFSQRNAQVESNLEAKGLTRDTASGGQKNAAALEGRSAKVQVPRSELQPQWEKRAEQMGLDVEGIKAKAIAREFGRRIEKVNEFTEANKAIGHAIEHLSEREQVFTRAEVTQFANKFAKGKASASHIEHALAEAERQGGLVVREGDANKSGALHEKFTTPKAIELERESVSIMLKGKGVMPVIASPMTIRDLLAEFEDRKADELGKPFKLNAGQREAVIQILSSKDQFTALQGFAGTGKTTIMEAVREISQRLGVEVIGLSAGAKQAAILERDSGIKSDTVAMFLQMKKKAQATKVVEDGERDKTNPPVTGQEAVAASRQGERAVNDQSKANSGASAGRPEFRWKKSDDDSRVISLAKMINNRSADQREQRRDGVRSRDVDLWGVLPKGKYVFTKEGTFRANTGLGAFRNNLAIEAQQAMREKRWDAEKNGQVIKALGMRVLERSAASMVRWEKQDIATAVLARAVDRIATMAADKQLHARVQKVFSKAGDLLSAGFRTVTDKVAAHIQDQHERSKQVVDKSNLSWAAPASIAGGNVPVGAVTKSARVGIVAPSGEKIFVPTSNLSWASPAGLNGGGNQWDAIEDRFSKRVDRAIARFDAIPAHNLDFDKRVSTLQSAISAAENELAKSYKLSKEGVWAGKQVGDTVEGRIVDVSRKELEKPDGTKYSTPTATIETPAEQKVTIVGVDLPRALGHLDGSTERRFDVGDSVSLTYDGNRVVQVPERDKAGNIVMADVKRNSFSVEDLGNRIDSKREELAEARQLLAEIQSARIESVETQRVGGAENFKPGQMRDRPTKLLIVDEASMLSLKDMVQLERVAATEGIRVVWAGDKEQHSSVEAGPAFERQLDAGIARTILTEVTRLSESNVRGRDAYKTLVPDISFMGEKGLRVIGKEGDPVAAFKALKGVEIDGTSIKDKAALLDRIAEDYVATGTAKAIIVTATNADRTALNEAVREEMVKRGKLVGPEASVVSMVRIDMTKTEGRFASSYEVGQTIEAGRAYKGLGVDKNERFEIIGIDQDKNLLRVRAKDGRELSINPERNTGFKAYATERIQLAAGDQIRITKNDRDRGISNGDIGIVTKVDGNKVTFSVRGKEHTIDTTKEHHLGYLYATTTVGAQGDTKLKTMYYINTERTGGVGLRSFYVGITRAKDDTIIYADSLQKASEIVGRTQDKSAALTDRELQNHVREELRLADAKHEDHDVGYGR